MISLGRVLAFGAAAVIGSIYGKVPIASADGTAQPSNPSDWPVCVGGPQTGQLTPPGDPNDLAIPHCRAVPSGQMNIPAKEDVKYIPHASTPSATAWAPQNGHYFTGLLTSGGSYDGIQASLPVTDPTFIDGAQGQFYSMWNMAQDSSGKNMTQGGWIAEVNDSLANACTNAVPFVFFENETNGSYGPIDCFNMYTLNAGSSYFFETVLDFDGKWGDWLWWNNTWNLLGENKLPFGPTNNNSYVETLGEAWDNGGSNVPRVGSLTVTSQEVENASPQVWESFSANIPNQNVYTPPYCLYSSDPFYSWTTWNEPTNHC